MSALKAAGINTVLMGAMFTSLLGFGWVLAMINGQPVDVLNTWLWLWSGIASISLAVALLTFIVEITDYLEAKMTRTPRARGRHVRR
ncbi:hypothetical protein D3I60_00075 [Brevibacterium permense]|uniref:hypothetical protein n=1 Tax=Brevibacterium permense TaxID=234834 RepID=UPI0021D1FA55|nr:hypothetical protein [Brevibacterium permense]MCU4295493.1 hypothetical protein [Brevibacterium permense]